MSVQLPAVSWLAQVKPFRIRFGADLTPGLGGPVQRVSRLGTRFGVAVDHPRMSIEDASSWLAGVFAADDAGDTVLVPWPKNPALANVGAPVVNGAGQTGTTLKLAGLTHALVIPKLTFFSFVVSGRNYLHCTTAAATVDGTGGVSLPVSPMLRASPADAAAVALTQPQIEGFIDGSTVGWDLDALTTVGISFTLREIE